jgi:hypothetical protein
VDQGKPELGGSGVAPPYGQMPVYDQRIQYEGGYGGPVEIQQKGTMQRDLGGEPVRRELGDTGGILLRCLRELFECLLLDICWALVVYEYSLIP